jgi:hypothetical protein
MGTRLARLIVAIFAALAMTVLVSARAAFSQDAEDSAAVADASSEPTGPALDEDADAADKVLEIPQVACADDGVSVPCTDGSDEDADGAAVNASSPGAPPTPDDETADARSPNQDWGTLSEYQNAPAYGVPYAGYASPMTVAAGTMNRPSQFPASPYVPMSSPLTQAARPPLNPGPWMLSPSMSPFSHPAGNPMIGMTMLRRSFGFHR